jgi:hypothetical protein
MCFDGYKTWKGHNLQVHNITNVRNKISETTGWILIIWQNNKWQKKTIKCTSRKEELQK